MNCERVLVLALVSLWSSWYPGTEAVDGTCGADFLPSSTTASSGSISEDVQVVLSPAFAGCGRLMRYNVFANCPRNGNHDCNIVFQIWRPTETGYFTLVNSTSTGFNPKQNNHQPEILSFSLDMEFTAGDMVGLNLDQPDPLDVRTAPAGNRSYLQWSSGPNQGNMLSAADATTITSHLPVLNVEGTCHPCPSTLQTMSISESMSSSLTDDATASDGLPITAISTDTSSGGKSSSTTNGDSTTTVTAGATSAASSTITTGTSFGGQALLTSRGDSTTTVTVRATSIVPTAGGRERSDAGSSVPHSQSSLPPSSASSRAATAIVPTTGGQERSDAGSSVQSSPPSLPAFSASSSAATSIVPTTGRQEGSGASAGVVAGVAVGLVLAMVVVVVLVVAIVLAAVCSVQRRRRKFYPTSNETYEVALDTLSANCNPEAAPYEIPLSSGKGSLEGVHTVPCEVDEPEDTNGPRAYEVPSSSTLPLAYKAVSSDCVEANDRLQGKTHFNMGCHDNRVLCNPTARPTYDSISEHEYQETEDVDLAAERSYSLLEEYTEQEPFPIYGFVPTVGERRCLKADEAAEYELPQQSHVDVSPAYYSNSNVPRSEEQRGGTHASNGSNVVEGVYEPSSTDVDTYWSPSSKEEEIYAQMSRCKYQEIPRDKLKMLTKLGEGEFGEVYKAVLKTPTGTSQDVAVKVVKTGAPQEERLKLLQEAAILGQFRHRHVVSLFGVVTLGEPKMMVMELLPGDLKSHLGQISESDSLRSDPDLPSLLLQFCKQVVDGLVCLAGKSFVHRDIAARNILLDKELNCKISDFGMTREVESETYYTLSKGAKIPIKWTAPEAILYKKYSTSSDVWSYGMLMYEIWSLGHKPFESNTVQEMIQLLDAHYCLPPPPGCPREVYSVMVDCWNPTHTERPTAVDILGNFCKSERVLLAWRAEDPVSPLSRTLGAPLSEGETLHRDLQNKYKDSLVKQ